MKFQITPKEYNELLGQLRQEEGLFGFVLDKIHYDYSRERHQLIVRMLTRTHELFRLAIEDEIQAQLETIRRSHLKIATTAFAEKVRRHGSTTVYLPDKEHLVSQHDPDVSFGHDDAHFPGVVIEVASSHKTKDLSSLADDYILDSNANIRAVVGFDIEYGKTGHTLGMNCKLYNKFLMRSFAMIMASLQIIQD
ncbi:hypothetical protein DV735_g4384, partial [Chaetothyriales sp. CBS 134920]